MTLQGSQASHVQRSTSELFMSYWKIKNQYGPMKTKLQRGSQGALQRCGLVGKVADRIAAIDLRMFTSSDPKIGVVTRNYL